MRRAMGALAVIVLLIGCAVGTTRLAAQVVSGSISGTAADTTGAVVPEVQVRATNQATRVELTTVTDKGGAFRLNLLPVGTYTVELSKTGFQTASLANIVVNAGVDRGLGPVQLQLGSVTTKVVVNESSTALIETTQAQVSTTFTSSYLTSFAGVQENQGLDSFLLQLPGVINARDQGFANSDGAVFSVNGLRQRNNDEQIDGQNNNDNVVAGPALFVANPDFVQETQVSTSNFGPEYGRNSGSVVNQITRSGTNNWHGAIAGNESNTVYNSLTNTAIFFNHLKKLPRTNNEFTSAAVGGPMVKDHAFIFGGFDDNIVASNTQYTTVGVTPTANGIAQLAACYPNSSTVAALSAIGPAAISAGNPRIVGAPFTTTTTESPVTPGGTCNVQLATLARTLGTPTHIYDWVTKADLSSGPNRFYARYLFQHTSVINADAGSGAAASGFPNNIPSLAQNIVLGWTRSITSAMTNEFRVGFGRTHVEFGGNSIGNVPTAGALADALTSIAIGADGPITYQGMGVPNNTPSQRIVNTWQGQDNWAYVHGRHQWKAGVNFTYQRTPNTFLPGLNGIYNFNPIASVPVAISPTGCSPIAARASLSALTSFACNVPNFIAIANGPTTLDYREKDTFLYVGDDFRIKDNLTLNLGLTWTYYGQPANLFHDITTKRESNPATAFWNTKLPLSARTNPTIPVVYNSFGPSVGFAWTPRIWQRLTGNGKTVVRGGYRLSYDPAFYNIYLNVAAGAPAVLASTVQGIQPNGKVLQLPASGKGPDVRASLAQFLALGTQDPRSNLEINVPSDFGPDRVHQWSFGIQRELTTHTVFESRYVGNHGFDLFQAINGNPLVSSLAASFPNLVPKGVTGCAAGNVAPPPGSTASPATGRENCNEGLLLTYSNQGYSDYNGIQNEFRANNFFNQLTMTASYTFSKATDNASEVFNSVGGGSTIAYAQNPFDIKKGEHGLSGLDVPHQFTANAIEALPFFRNQPGVLGRFLGGWSLSGNYILASGQPYTPIQLFLDTLSGGFDVDNPWQITVPGINDSARPFVGNLSAPATSVGIFAGDACSVFGAACKLAPNTLIDFSTLNSTLSTTATVTPVTQKQVRLIVNGAESEKVFNSPFGNATRNSLRDYWQNIANIGVFKSIKFNERSALTLHMTMLNAFNHPNFNSIDPIIEHAGGSGFANGFGNPRLFPGAPNATAGVGQRQLFFGAKITW